MYFCTKTFLLFFCVSNVLSEKCRTPNNETGECVSIRSCPTLLNSLATLRPEAIELVKKHECGLATEALVCCASSPTHVTSTVPTVTVNKMDLLPSKRYCGYQRFDDYFHTETSASSIDEFPWLVAIVFKDVAENDHIACAGSLISNRYVLTGAGCITPSGGQSLSVEIRLGEYNAVKKEDCIKSEQYDNECTDPIPNLGIEEIIRHPQFRYRPRQHNIGLIRLNGTVTYNDFVRPICLPFPGSRLAKVGDVMYQSGWGRTSFGGNVSEIKKKIAVELLDLERCRQEYSSDPRNNITDYQTCTVELPSSAHFSCDRDGGGPVMSVHRNQWLQEGIVWYGKPCGYQFPSVNLNVVKYLDWILENIRP